MTYNGKGNIQYNLPPKPLKAGGEGEIYDIIGQSSSVAKIYKPGKVNPEKERKLIRMINFPPDKSALSQIAWPQDVLYDNAGKFVGFVMPKMKINEDLNVIYEYGSSAKYPNMQWENRIIIAKNLCVVLHYIHEIGYVCGDLNPKNISVDPKTGFVVFLDTDSYHIEDGNKIYRCDVGMPEYLPAEIQKKMRGGSNLATASLPTFSVDTDNFALAIHIFQLLMNGVHPFACAIIPSQSSVTFPQPSDNIERGEFPFMQSIPGISIPVFAPKITILPQDIQDLFKRTFIDGHNSPSVRPKPEEWHTALESLGHNLKTCKKVSHHQYYENLKSCPWCEANESFNKTLNKVTLSQTQIKPQVVPPKPYVTPTSSGSVYRPKKQGKPLSAGGKLAVAFIMLCALVMGFGLFNGWFAGNNKNQKKYKIGDTGPAGGIVFYDKRNSKDGWRYLEAAPTDLSKAVAWGGFMGAKLKKGIGYGKQNTEQMIAFNAQYGITETAADLCKEYNYNGHSDWFLPSRDELNKMYNSFKTNNLRGFFKNSMYWSSSSDGNGNPAWSQDFTDGKNGKQYNIYSKESKMYVRPVRAF